MDEQTLAETLAAIKQDMLEETGQLFVAMAAEYLTTATSGGGAVTTSSRPEDMHSRFAEPLPEGRLPIDQIVNRIRRDVLPDILKLAHPMYMGVNVAPPLPAALWAETLIAALNQSVRVFS